jgi:hypothetical protein
VYITITEGGNRYDEITGLARSVAAVDGIGVGYTSGLLE